MEPLEDWQLTALLVVAEHNIQEVRANLPEDVPAMLVQKLAVANKKVVAARDFISQGWVRCPKCNVVSYSEKNIDLRFCSNCDKSHDQFDPITSQEKR